MSGLADLRPGDIGFGPLKGLANPAVMLGQLLLGEGFKIGSMEIGHVFVITEALHDELPSPKWPTGVINSGSLIEAMPSGAREVPIMLDRWTPDYTYVRIPEDYPGQADDAAAIARAMLGTPYSFASYAALAAWRFGIKTGRLEKWIDRRRPVTSLQVPTCPVPMDFRLPAEAICSVLADQAWSLTGKQVMPAGTPHQCVTPGALARTLLMDMPDVQWFWPKGDPK